MRDECWGYYFEFFEVTTDDLREECRNCIYHMERVAFGKWIISKKDLKQ